MGKSKRGSGPRPGSNRAERVAERKARVENLAGAVSRPFAGFAAECDLVALRAFVASATVEVTLKGNSQNIIELVTILPGAVSALTRTEEDNKKALVALQTAPEPTDPAAALAAALHWAATAESGESFTGVDDSTLQLAEILDPATELKINVHDNFQWWFANDVELSAEMSQGLTQANQSIMHTARLDLASAEMDGLPVGAPWWIDPSYGRAHLRWLRPEPEDEVMAALARLHADGNLHLGEGSKFAGSFRTHGLLVPVFDLDEERHPSEWTSAATTFGKNLAAALAETGELTSEQRRSRDGIRSRQVTLR